MKIKVSNATNIQIDWLVAKIETKMWLAYENAVNNESPLPARPSEFLRDNNWSTEFSPSTDWAQGGPIIERGLLSPEPILDNNCALIKWQCRNWKGDGADFYGITHLVAGLRCHVGYELGYEVDVPEELT